MGLGLVGALVLHTSWPHGYLGHPLALRAVLLTYLQPGLGGMHIGVGHGGLVGLGQPIFFSLQHQAFLAADQTSRVKQLWVMGLGLVGALVLHTSWPHGYLGHPLALRAVLLTYLQPGLGGMHIGVGHGGLVGLGQPIFFS